MNASEISALLTNQAGHVAQMLLPNGKREGRYWVAGSVDGDSGKSLKVNIEGDKAGRFCDYASQDDYGDLIDLWRLTRKIPLHEAIKQARSYLGIEEKPMYSGKAYQKPKNFGGKKDSDDLDYLRLRGLTNETIAAFRITAGDGKIYFPFFEAGELVGCKWRSIYEKEIRATSSGQRPILFGWQCIRDMRDLVICEGEIDAMSLWQVGYNAVSVPFGANNLEWIENQWDLLACYDRIYICMDSDRAGKEAARKIIHRLGVERCMLVDLPMKDANEALTDNRVDELHHAFRVAVYLDPKEIKRPEEYREEARYEIYPERRPAGSKSIPLPCKKNRDVIEFREAELILINGVNGHGKSQWAGQAAIEAMRHGFKVFIASMEMRPSRTLGRMIRQLTGIDRPTDEYIDQSIDWLNDKAYLFDCLGDAPFETMMACCEYAAKRHGVQLFLIDSMMKLGVADDDYAGQKKIISRLCDFKNKFGSTILLVTHSRKGESEYKPTGKFDVLGSSAITNLADTVLSVWRNKPKEEKLESGEDVADLPDCIVSCSKHRNGDWEGRIGYWFDRGSYQYLSGPDSKVFPYLDKTLRAVQ